LHGPDSVHFQNDRLGNAFLGCVDEHAAHRNVAAAQRPPNVAFAGEDEFPRSVPLVAPAIGALDGWNDDRNELQIQIDAECDTEEMNVTHARRT
jgi:hypothetical protein